VHQQNGFELLRRRHVLNVAPWARKPFAIIEGNEVLG